MAQAVSGISNVIISHAPNDINLDFADVKTVMSHKGLALMGSGTSKGASAAHDAAKAAIDSPLLDNVSIKGAKGVLVHFHIHPEYPLLQISEAMKIIEDHADIEANVIFGTTTDENLELDEVKITLVATGFERSDDDSDTTSSQTVSATKEVKKETPSVAPANSQSKSSESKEKDTLDFPSFLRE